MSEATPRFSGFFSRRKNNESNAHTRTTSSDVPIPRIETTRTSLEEQDQSTSAIKTRSQPRSRRESDSSENKSFFRIPRRKKASSLSADEAAAGRMSIDRQPSMDQTRLSSQTTRSPFEAFLRPSLNSRFSSGHVTPSSLTGSALVAASTTLAVQGSPNLEISDPLEGPIATRPLSTRSVRSFRSTHSTPASEHSNGTGDQVTRLQNRGRSRTFAGESPQKATNSRSSKFFSMGRLLREPEDVSLFRPLSRDLSPYASSASQRKVEFEKPSAPTLPCRIDGESSSQFLARVEARTQKTLAASVLATSDDPFHYECLQLYMQQFNFVHDPLDIALRKFLMDTHLPKETQQIDRVLNAFSARYQTCNPRLYESAVTPYVLSFALIMLHTDRFNQNNKYKMTKAQFLKNTSSEHTESVNTDVLEYFYDNIVSTPFILVEDEHDVQMADSGPTTPNEVQSARQGSLSTLSVNQQNGTFGKRNLDLYPLIMENKLDSLRPQLGSILEHDHALAYTGTLPVINVAKLHNAFTHPATLQLISARSRPEAFVTDHSIQNPLDTDPGLVDIQITKIGILRRKEQKKAGSKPVYREWGVMLTPSQLLLFKNVAWVKHYMHQARDYAKSEPLILAPPVHNFAPDSYMPTADTVAMWDSTMSKKPTHFCFFGRGGERTHLIASSEEEMNDWVAKINYAAAFQTVGIRIRGISIKQTHSENSKRLRHQSSVSTISTLSSSLASQAELRHARQNLLRMKIKDMDAKVKAKEQHLSLLQQHGRNLCTLTPIQPRTRASVISAAGSLSAKLSWAHVELVKTQCHRDILAKDLELETDPSISVFTAPMRSSTPPPGAVPHKTSPSKNKLGTVMSSLVRQVSTDTLKRVNRQFGGLDIKRSASDITLRKDEKHQHTRGLSDLGADYISNVDFTADTLNHMFLNSPIEPDGQAVDDSQHSGSATATGASSSNVISKDVRPRSSSGLKLQMPFSRRSMSGHKNRADIGEVDDNSVLSSPSSGQSSGHFILHGRKVSVVQAPPSLLDSTLHGDQVISPQSSSRSNISVSSSVSTEVYEDAPEIPHSPSN